jgi:RHS repeat-associated protein
MTVAYGNNGAVALTQKYNGKGERVWIQKGGINIGDPRRWFLYDESGRLLGEYGFGGGRVNEYVYLNDELVAKISGGNPGEIRYVETDHLGTPRALFTTAGQKTWDWDFFGSAFGEHAANDAADSNGTLEDFNLRFPGQYYDAKTGLFYNYFRDYEPQTGRYLESDPIGLRGGLSTYGYAFGAPISYSDRSGSVAGAAAGLCFIPGVGWVSCAGAAGGAALAGLLCWVTGACGAISNGIGDLIDSLCAEEDEDCNAHFTRCLETSLNDAVGGSYGWGRCSLCRDTCVQQGGTWPSMSHTGDRCDYWNFR